MLFVNYSKRFNKRSFSPLIRTLSLSAEEINYLNQKPYVMPNRKKILAPSMVYISGEEMTRYTVKIL